MAFVPARILGLTLASLLLSAATCAVQAAGPSAAGPTGSSIAASILSGTLQDALGRPVPRATVRLKSADGTTLQNTTTDNNGLFRLNQPAPGIYSITAGSAAFGAARITVVVPLRARKRIEITLEPKHALSLPVTASLIRAQNGLSSTGTSKYTLTSKDITNLSEGQATPLSQVILQMPGVALDQNQEIHIRGEHMGIQYQMNGILLPLDMNTDPTFTQLLNSYFVQRVSLIDGVLPAQYGYRTSGVIDIRTRDGCEDATNDVTIIGGQRDTAQTNFRLGGCGRGLSYYLTGTFLQSNSGFNSAVPAPDPIHDAVTQGQGFAYLSYAPGPAAKLTLISGMTLAFNQFPNQPNLAPQYRLDEVNPVSHPSSAINSGLNQRDYYGLLAVDGVLGRGWDYELAYSAHYNSQTFYPDPKGDLIYQGVASNVFTSDLSNSLQGDLTYHLGSAHRLRGGFYLGEYGVESDQTSKVFPVVTSRPGTSPFSVTANLNKINLVCGIYIEDTWQIIDRVSVNFGSRWDQVSGFTSDSQFSPTINFVYKPRGDTALHAGFARSFQVPNFQNVSAGIFKLFKNTTGAVGTSPTGNAAPLAETDYTWDAGFTHQLTAHLAFAQDNYFRIDRNYLDEGQFGFVPVDAPFNYVRGYGGGTENSITYNEEKIAARLNVFLAREEDIGVASGQYNFPADELSYIDRHYIVLDHSPLIGASGGLAYRWNDYQFTFDGLFSSGLRGGFANQTQLPKVWQFNLSAARDFAIPHLGKFTNRMVLLNVFDRTNLIRPANGIGVFQAAYGPRITVFDALTIPLPSL